MTQQPEALRLANWCDANSSGIYRPSAEAAEALRSMVAKIAGLEAEVRALSDVVDERNQLEAQRDALLEVLMLCQQAGLHRHILNTGESLASVIDAAIKAVEGVKHD